MRLLSLTSLVLLSIAAGDAFPHHAQQNFDWDIFPGAQPPPPPIEDTSSKQVHDWLHPYLPPTPLDQRGPCPGLNTLANHGYLPRIGVATPAQIITAVQEGFNMGYDLAAFSVYGAFVVDGNHETNLMSIGGETNFTGPNPPEPAVVGGLNAHELVEGDASTTRSDHALGNNHEFNITLFNQLVKAANDHGNGTLNHYSAAEHRYNRILDSIARNPVFDLTIRRFLTAYAETSFPLRYFVNGTKGYLPDGSMPSLDLETALGFFRDARFPKEFFRREGPYGFAHIQADTNWFLSKHPVPPGRNQGVGNYVPTGEPVTFCAAYIKQLEHVTRMYPPDKVEGRLRNAVKGNLRTLFAILPPDSVPCEELFPYGE